jgi:nucleoside-diphosphate-sugar epimerase
MTAKKILITGASGCIGHYITEKLIRETQHELYLLVRNPDKLGFDYKARPQGINILQADLRDIDKYNELLKTIDVAILAATAWGGWQDVYDINIVKTIELIKSLSPEVCQQVIYFSTASILDHNNQLLKEAGEIGTDYIRTKYECMVQLSQLTNIPPITAVFPTLVIGGAENKPYSHLTSGLPFVVKLIDLARWFKADGSFHFIHGVDIAQVVSYLVENPSVSNELRKFVLGAPAIAVNEAVEQTCAYLRKKIYYRVELNLSLANFFIWLFRVKMAEWDRFCLNYRHFTYQNPVNPKTIELPMYCETMTDVLRVIGIPAR